MSWSVLILGDSQLIVKKSCFKFYVGHPGVSFKSYGHYADSVIYFSEQFSNVISFEICWPTWTNFVWRILGRGSTKVVEISLIEHFLQSFLHFFQHNFHMHMYLLWSSCADWLQILWGGSLVSTKVIEIMLIQQFFIFANFVFIFFRTIFKRYLLWHLWDRLTSNFMWGILSLLNLSKLCWLSIVCIFAFFNIFSAQFSDAISSEVPEPVDFKFYVNHPVKGLYQSYGNYAEAAILSAEHPGP